MNMPQLQLWSEFCEEAHMTLHENWDYPKPESSKYFPMTNCIHTTSAYKQSFPMDAISQTATTTYCK
jgi:hypothetical protein